MNPTPEDLQAIPLFASLSSDQLQKLAAWFDVQQADIGRRLTGEGAPGYAFFVLGEGTASVTVEGAEVATLDPGDVFGEAAILGNGRRTATVTTTSPALIEVLMRQRVGASAWPGTTHD